MRIAKVLSASIIVSLILLAGVYSTPVGAQAITRIYGTFNGNPIALLASSAGLLRVTLAAGSAPPTFSAGGGSATFTPSGVIEANTTQTGTPASTAETDLWTYSLPASTLNADLKTLRIKVAGTYAANANNKTVKLYFGATVVGSTGAVSQNGGTFNLFGEIIRTAVGAQLAHYTILRGGTLQTMTLSTPAETTTGAIVIKVTGENGTAAANDIVFRLALVEMIK